MCQARWVHGIAGKATMSEDYARKSFKAWHSRLIMGSLIQTYQVYCC